MGELLGLSLRLALELLPCPNSLLPINYDRNDVANIQKQLEFLSTPLKRQIQLREIQSFSFVSVLMCHRWAFLHSYMTRSVQIEKYSKTMVRPELLQLFHQTALSNLQMTVDERLVHPDAFCEYTLEPR